MAMKFDSSKIKDLVWPDTLGVLTALGTHYLSKAIDAKMGWTKIARRTQDYVAAGGFLVPGTLYAMGKGEKFNKAWFTSNFALVGEGIVDKVLGPPEEIFKVKLTRKVTQKTGQDEAPTQALQSGLEF